jgi:hypothetical protein
MRIIFLLPIMLVNGALVFAQQDSAKTSSAQRWLKKNERFVPEIKGMVQLWGIWSSGMEVYNTDKKLYEPVDDRFNLSFRRARLSVSGEPYHRLKYTVVLFYDQIGRDVLASGIGAANKADPPVGIWDAFFQWKITGGEALNLVGGWFRPQMQRESITSGWSVNSFEKSMSQNYVRTHLVGTGPGRAMGLNLGGLLGKKLVRANYNLGVFNPVTAALSGTSAGKKFAPLLSGRTSVSIGDPELKKYAIAYDVNYFNQRKGVTLDFNASWQGETDVFKNSTAFGPGILLNWGSLNLDGEWIWMQRKSNDPLPLDTLVYPTAKAATGHVRLGVNLPAGRFVAEPVFMVMKFSGEKEAQAQHDAEVLGMSSGSETTYDAGINWYLDGKNLKLLLHYTWRDGDPGDAGDGAKVNMFFNQNGVGAIRRGNWIGAGIHAIF